MDRNSNDIDFSLSLPPQMVELATSMPAMQCAALAKVAKRSSADNPSTRFVSSGSLVYSAAQHGSLSIKNDRVSVTLGKRGIANWTGKKNVERMYSDATKYSSMLPITVSCAPRQNAEKLQAAAKLGENRAGGQQKYNPNAAAAEEAAKAADAATGAN